MAQGRKSGFRWPVISLFNSKTATNVDKKFNIKSLLSMNDTIANAQSITHSREKFLMLIWSTIIILHFKSSCLININFVIAVDMFLLNQCCQTVLCEILRVPDCERPIILFVKQQNTRTVQKLAGCY